MIQPKTKSEIPDMPGLGLRKGTEGEIEWQLTGYGTSKRRTSLGFRDLRHLLPALSKPNQKALYTQRPKPSNSHLASFIMYSCSFQKYTVLLGVVCACSPQRPRRKGGTFKANQATQHTWGQVYYILKPCLKRKKKKNVSYYWCKDYQ